MLAGSPLPHARHAQVIDDTLRGEAGAKRSWPDRSMTQDVSAGLKGFTLPADALIDLRAPTIAFVKLVY